MTHGNRTTDAFGVSSKHASYVSGREHAARRRFQEYLNGLPDAHLVRIYKEALAAGRRVAANLTAIEAGKRLTKRADPKGCVSSAPVLNSEQVGSSL